MKQVSVSTYRLSVVPKIFRLGIVLSITAYCSLLTAVAQVDELPKDAAPPPLKVVSKDERKVLDAETNPKKRAQLTMDLMEVRLKNAEAATAQNDFQTSINELAIFQALLDDALDYLIKKDAAGSKIGDTFKRLEINLRKIVPRIELVRREMPFKYGYYVEKVQKFVRDARARAVEPLFDDSVVKDSKPTALN